MEVEMPTTGCNILRSANSFYNYSTDNRTRTNYYIIDGKAIASETTTNNMGYSYTGYCIQNGEIIYKPEVRIYYPFMAFLMIFIILIIIYNIIFKRFLK